MKLVIKRSKWLHSEGAARSRLLRESDGKMCCLGFYGLACGLSKQDILNKNIPKPAVIKENNPAAYDKMKWLFNSYFGRDGLSGSAVCLITENDGNADESSIFEMFAEHDVQVEFVD